MYLHVITLFHIFVEQNNNVMETFKSNIINQIEKIEDGKIFTFQNLSFPMAKFAHVAVILCNLNKEGKILRAERGAYYKPRKSKLGLGVLPIYQDEQFNYITNKLNGYLTGAYIYNKLSLTEQTATIITIATPTPVRRFKFKNLEFECVKAYVYGNFDTETIHYLRLLDAIKDIKHISGCTEQDIYGKIKQLHLQTFSHEALNNLVSLAIHYPPRVRKVLSDMMGDLQCFELQNRLIETILPTTRFELSYQRVLAQ